MDSIQSRKICVLKLSKTYDFFQILNGLQKLVSESSTKTLFEILRKPKRLNQPRRPPNPPNLTTNHITLFVTYKNMMNTSFLLLLDDYYYKKHKKDWHSCTTFKELSLLSGSPNRLVAVLSTIVIIPFCCYF